MINQLKDAIEITVKHFQEDPISFLSERDIQSVLFVELRKTMSNLKYEYPAAGKNSRFGCDKQFYIRPITTEYYVYSEKNARFDIAVLSDRNEPNSDLWRQPCRIAIEIKLWQPGYGRPGYSSDVDKLLRYKHYFGKPQFTGIAMVFVHPWVEKKKIKAICDDNLEVTYPENGVALHLVTEERHYGCNIACLSSLVSVASAT